MNRVVPVALALAVLISPFALGAAEVRVGVLAYRGAERAADEWQPTIRHLDKALPDHRFQAVPLDIPNLSKAVEDGRVDFVITNPGHYVE
ncbi:MAG: PhnD/SsuA/transferrin family substrate-binding protein, partial [Alphaproteobacteria bacterium]|nr:PhnD/SsuA/transferrin family substrate-binding protein [Alphaproteobacteria bacterium]